jgi:hypothetical protein
MNLIDFLNMGGQERRKMLDNYVDDLNLERFLPPNLRPAGQFVNEMNPVNAMGSAMQDASVVFDPQQTAEARKRAALDMGLEMAMTLAPAALVRMGYLTAPAGLAETFGMSVDNAAENARGLISDATYAARSVAEGDPRGVIEAFQRGGTPQSVGAAGIGDNGGPSISNAVPRFSPSLRAAENLKQNKGTYEQMRGMLLKAGAKADELEWSGADAEFKGKKVTKDDLISYLQNNDPRLTVVKEGSSGRLGLSEKNISLKSNKFDEDFFFNEPRNKVLMAEMAQSDFYDEKALEMLENGSLISVRNLKNDKIDELLEKYKDNKGLRAYRALEEMKEYNNRADVLIKAREANAANPTEANLDSVMQAESDMPMLPNIRFIMPDYADSTFASNGEKNFLRPFKAAKFAVNTQLTPMTDIPAGQTSVGYEEIYEFGKDVIKKRFQGVSYDDVTDSPTVLERMSDPDSTYRQLLERQGFIITPPIRNPNLPDYATPYEDNAQYARWAVKGGDDYTVTYNKYYDPTGAFPQQQVAGASHFGEDDDFTQYHTRSAKYDRPDGGRALHLMEIQSDAQQNMGDSVPVSFGEGLILDEYKNTKNLLDFKEANLIELARREKEQVNNVYDVILENPQIRRAMGDIYTIQKIEADELDVEFRQLDFQELSERYDATKNTLTPEEDTAWNERLEEARLNVMRAMVQAKRSREKYPPVLDDGRFDTINATDQQLDNLANQRQFLRADDTAFIPAKRAFKNDPKMYVDMMRKRNADLPNQLDVYMLNDDRLAPYGSGTENLKTLTLDELLERINQSAKSQYDLANESTLVANQVSDLRNEARTDFFELPESENWGGYNVDNRLGAYGGPMMSSQNKWVDNALREALVEAIEDPEVTHLTWPSSYPEIGTVGGGGQPKQGAIDFYNRDIKNRANKLLRSYDPNAQIEEGYNIGGNDYFGEGYDISGEPTFGFDQKYRVNSVELTPSLVDAVMKKGIPTFAALGALPLMGVIDYLKEQKEKRNERFGGLMGYGGL